jgi:ribosomal protein S18 acetylase RimI-like enzyme
MINIIRATAADLPALLALMRDFYAAEHLVFTAEVEQAASELIGNPSLGSAFMVQDDRGVAGYFVLCYGFSVERGGKTALLDELYIIPASRGKGLGKAALAQAITLAKTAGCRTLHLEVDHANDLARNFYDRAGFTELPRGYLTLEL